MNWSLILNHGVMLDLNDSVAKICMRSYYHHFKSERGIVPIILYYTGPFPCHSPEMWLETKITSLNYVYEDRKIAMERHIEGGWIVKMSHIERNRLYKKKFKEKKITKGVMGTLFFRGGSSCVRVIIMLCQKSTPNATSLLSASTLKSKHDYSIKWIARSHKTYLRYELLYINMLIYSKTRLYVSKWVKPVQRTSWLIKIECV